MLIEFTVGNYRSFAAPATMSMIAAKLSSTDKQVDANNVFELPNQPQLLVSTAIYGANASGKSNFINALRFMRRFVMRSTNNTSATGVVDVEPYLLQINTKKQPTHFETVFIAGEQRYRYGFEANKDQVVSEWLYFVPTRREARLFERHGQDITLSDAFREGRELIDKTRPNALFLSVAAEFNGKHSLTVIDWFRKLGIHSGLTDSTFRSFTEARLRDDLDTQAILDLVRRLDVGIKDIRVEDYLTRVLRQLYTQSNAADIAEGGTAAFLSRLEPEQLKRLLSTDFIEPIPDIDKNPNRVTPSQSLDTNDADILRYLSLQPSIIELLLSSSSENYRKRSYAQSSLSVVTIHDQYDENGNVVGEEAFDLDRHESEGTKKLFALAGYLVSVFQTGAVLIVDELDARLHPIITREIVKLFSNPIVNKNHAQLIFTTQDTNLLDTSILRRDQIWFVEKDSKGSSHLYSLAEFKGVRNDLSLERNYIHGRFGAIPYIGDLAAALTGHEEVDAE